MDEVHSALGRAMTPEEYADQWSIESTSYEKESCYRWMSEQLGLHSLVLEVGCGQGKSTLAIAQKSKVVCIEPNEFMAKACNLHMQQNNISSEIIELTELSKNNSFKFDSQVTIILGDLLSSESEQFIVSLKPTAIACWLIGADPYLIAHHINKELETFDGPEAKEYRIKIHKRCYEIGTQISQHNCIVHLVDRMSIESWSQKSEVRKELVKMHTDLSNGNYDIPFDFVFLRKFDHLDLKSEIKMVSEFNPHRLTPVLASVKATAKNNVKTDG